MTTLCTRNYLIAVSTLACATALALSSAMADDPIVIGMAVAKTGALAPYDIGPMNAALLAIDDINAKGGLMGRQLKAVISDTKSDPALGPTAATEVLQQKAEMVLVSCDFDYGSPAALTAQAAGKVTFSACAADPKFGVQGIGPYAYTMSVSTTAQGPLVAEFAYKKGFRKVYILKDVSLEYDKSLCDNFRWRFTQLAGDGGIVGEENWNGINDSNISELITRLKAKGASADAIMYCGSINIGGNMRQLRAAGIDLPILASENMDGDYWQAAVPNISKVFNADYGSVWGNDPDPKIRAFFEAYQKKFGERAVTAHALTGYSVIEAWTIAAQRAGKLDGAAIKAELDKFKDEPLLVGLQTYTPDLHISVSRAMLMMETEDGKHTPLERVKAEKPAPFKF
jgi:branched-chain amino acid transport system substrate-binding protein